MPVILPVSIAERQHVIPGHSVVLLLDSGGGLLPVSRDPVFLGLWRLSSGNGGPAFSEV